MARQSRVVHVADGNNRIESSMSRQGTTKGKQRRPRVPPLPPSFQSRQEEDGVLSKRDGGGGVGGSRSSVPRLLLKQATVVKVVEEVQARQTQVQNLSSEVQKKQNLVASLEVTIDKLRHELEQSKVKAKSDLDHQRSTALGQIDQLERTVEAKNEEIEYYEFQMRTRDKEVENLRRQLSESMARNAELEVQIEVHDFKFSSYEEYQRQLDREALERISANAFHSNATNDLNSIGDTSAESEQRYVGKLITDLDKMEKLYVKSKIEEADKVEDLKQQCRDYRVKISSLEGLLAAYRNQDVHSSGNVAAGGGSGGGGTGNAVDNRGENDGNAIHVTNSFESNDDSHFSTTSSSQDSFGGIKSSSFSSATPFIGPTVQLLKKRMKIIEMENIQHIQKIEQLQKELKKNKTDIKIHKEKSSRDLSSLKIENDGLINKISALEIEIGLMTGTIDAAVKSKRYSMLEKNLDDNIVEIMRLEDRLRMKERIISRLSNLAVQRRHERTMEKHTRQYSNNNSTTEQRRTKTMKSGSVPTKSSLRASFDDQRTASTVDMSSEWSTISDLQSQISSSHRQLREKEDAFNYMRAKYSAKVAKLKYRMTSAVQRHDGKSSPEILDLYFI